MNLLFSYGTLQDGAVQIATFGRVLNGTADTLIGYRVGRVAISDPEVVKKSGLSEHPVAIMTGDVSDLIAGTVLEITHEELHASDAYEVAEYERVWTTLKSGRGCWLYALRPDLLPNK